MEKKRSRYLSVIFGLVVAAVFLYLTFRRTDIDALWAQIRQASLLQTAGLVLLSWSILISRGFRWWYLLPRPHHTGDLAAAQRALILSYGVNNIASRVGELARVWLFKRDTGRDVAGIMSTVIVDRILFDVLMLVGLFALALFGFRDQIVGILPQIEPAFQGFLGVTFIGICGLFFLAYHPEMLLKVLERIGVSRFPRLWITLSALTNGLSQGLAVCAKPRQLLTLFVGNLVVWGLAVVYFWGSMTIIGVELDGIQAILFFTVSCVGLLLPSPGGLGTIHYFTTLSLTHLLAVPETAAAAAATYSHGVNYLAVTGAAFLCLFWKPRKLTRVDENHP